MRGARRSWAPAMVVTACALTAAMASVTRLAAEEGHWSAIASGRLVLGVVFALAWHRAVGLPRIGWPSEPWAWMRGLAAAVGIPMAFYAFSVLPSADAVTLMNTAPLWVVLAEAGLRGRRPSLRVVASVGVALVGVALLLRPGLVGLELGVAAALGNALARSLVVVAVSRASRTPAITLVVYGTVAALLVAGGITGVVAGAGGVALVPGRLPVFVGLIAIVALFGTVGNVLGSRGMLVDSARLAPLMMLTPVFAWLADLMLGAPLELRQVVAIALVLLGAGWGSRRERVLLELRATGKPFEVDVEGLEARTLAVEARAGVELRVHVEGGDVDALARAREVFETGGLRETRRHNGLLLYLHPTRGERVLVGDHGVEKRLVPFRMAPVMRLPMSEFWAAFEAELAFQIPARDDREDELENTPLLSGLDLG